MNVKTALLAALAGAGEGYISGSALADQLGVSRNAVWKAVKALEAEGYVIESVTAKGYRLSGKSNMVSAVGIMKHLNPAKLKELGLDPGFVNIGERAYCDECFNLLSREDGKWEVFYGEHGQKTNVRIFETEEKAAEALLEILTRGRKKGR